MILEVALGRMVETVGAAVGEKQAVVAPFRRMNGVNVVVAGSVAPL